MRFEGTPSYVATDDLKIAVNAAIALERPLLIKGEPGNGQDHPCPRGCDRAWAADHRVHIKSTTKAQQGLYEYDAVSRLRDGQLGDERVKDIRNYIKRGQVGGMPSRPTSGLSSSSTRSTRPTSNSRTISCSSSIA